MLKFVLITTALIVAVILGAQRLLVDHSLLRYMDEHPDPRWVPATAYYVGEGLMAFSNLTEATTYFTRVRDQYPASPYADDAFADYLSAIDTMPGWDRPMLVEENKKYLERFPEGKHAEVIRNRIDIYNNPR